MGDTAVLDHYLAPLRPFLEPEAVTEVVVNRPGEVGVEAAGLWRWHAVPDLTEAWLHTLAVAAAAFTRQDVDAEHPICSTVLPGNERCQIVLPPAVQGGMISLTIRKPSSHRMGLEDFEAAGLFAATAVGGHEVDPTDVALTRLREAGDWPGFFRLAVESRRNILISGATGSGKTTFAKGLVELIPPHERLLTIEDTRELAVPHRNAVHLLYAKDGQGLARTGPRVLLESALRMRPDRILLQELRDGAAAFFFLRTVNSGHPGSITTVHADSAALAFEQLTLLVRESEGGRDLPREDIRSLLHLMVDVVVQMKKVDGRFRMTEVWHDPARKRLARG